MESFVLCTARGSGSRASRSTSSSIQSARIEIVVQEEKDKLPPTSCPAFHGIHPTTSIHKNVYDYRSYYFIEATIIMLY
eukprot:scaffold262_cov164-Ochromonas_danica.AAC.4